MNVVVLRGTLSRTPSIKELASGSVLVSLDVTTRSATEETRTAPVVIFDPPKSVASLPKGTEVLVVGSVNRRWFRAGGVTQSRTEVVASTVARTSAAKRCAQLLTTSADEILDDSSSSLT